MFISPFTFEGRIRRTEFGISFLLVCVLFNLVQDITETSQEAAILELIYIPLGWFFVAQSVKRCHDHGRPGWFVLSPIFILNLLFSEGDPGKNIYGDCPKPQKGKSGVLPLDDNLENP